jgi:signal transduction histidine kinase
LSAASAILASSLDYEATLDSVARLAVPILGDWCTVYLLDEDGQVRRAAVAYADAAKAPLAAALRRYPPSPVSPHSSVAEAMRTGRPVVTPDIPDRYVEAIAQDPEHLAILRQLAFRVSLAVPLGARGETFGALALFSFDSGRRYDADDLATVEDLARRAGLAIDHARLYREAQRAIRARDEFLSVAAHELRTPITSLLGFAQLVRRQLAGTAPLNPLVADQALAAIDRQSARLRLLIGRLLDVSRLETGRLALDRRPADLVALAAGVVADARVRTGRHALRLEAPEHLVTTVDAVHIEQVLTNLVENAIK